MEYARTAETFIFLATATLKVYASRPEFKSQLLSDIIALVMRLPPVPPVLQTALVFFKKMGKLMRNYTELAEPCIVYTLKAIGTSATAKSLGCSAILSFAAHSPGVITPAQLEMLHGFLQAQYLTLAVEDAGMLSEAIALVIIAMPIEQISIISERCLSWIVKEISAPKAVGKEFEDVRRMHLLFNILSGYTAAFQKSELESGVLHAALSPAAVSMWHGVCESVKAYCGSPQFSEVATAVIKSFMYTSNEALVPARMTRGNV